MNNINEILSAYTRSEKSAEETNAALAAAGSRLTVKPGAKTGNALLNCGVGSPEPCTVEDGKLVGIGGAPHTDQVFYDGRWWNIADDGVTLEEKR